MPMTDARPRLTSGDTRPPNENPVSSMRKRSLLVAPPLQLTVGMIQRTGAFILVSALFGVGCVGDDRYEPNPPNPNELVCTDAFKVTGSWQALAPLRDPVETPTGCWPVGRWTFSATLDPSNDSILDLNRDGNPDRCGTVPGTSPAALKSSYVFTVNRTDIGEGWNETYVWDGAVAENGKWRLGDQILYKIKVSEGGGAECEGGMELLSLDGTMLWNFKPSLGTGTELTGVGEFTQYVTAKD
jgi:hypothetical protein